MPEPEVPANADELTPSGLVKGRPDEELVVAIDQWITEAGSDEHEMRARLMEVRLHLEDKT